MTPLDMPDLAAAAGRRPQDMAAFWMPFTANRHFKAAPRLIARAEGCWYEDVDGRRVIDGAAGLWCVNAGHGRKEIARAVAEQLERLDYAPTFQMGHPLPFETASRLKAIAPGDMNHVFFTNSGSESVDTALKIAIAYHRARGEGQRVRLIGRVRGYHGVGFGGTAVGGMVANRKAFGPLLPGVDHLPHTHDLARNAFSRGQPEHGAELADALEDLIALHDASTIAAVIVEPVAGSTGVLPPPKGYLERLRAITERHGVLLIFDEVITGFGRLGAAFAAERLGVLPDMITTAKGITNGAIPMGAVFARDHVHDAFMHGPEGMIELFHGYTYSGHPAACAAALTTLDIYRDEDLFARCARIAPIWQAQLHALADAPHVVDIRDFGLVGGIELARSAEGPGKRAFAAMVKAWELGAVVRVTGDTLAMSPPLTVTEAEIAHLLGIVRQALAAVD